jgi:hypothetical protein
MYPQGIVSELGTSILKFVARNAAQRIQSAGSHYI